MIRWRLEQICLAVVFLTRLPLAPFLPRDRIVALDSAIWAFPLAGGIVGTLAGLPLLIAGPPLLIAAISVTLSVWLTGALHEDGLADFADGMGGQTRERRLEIMRDSAIGSYGALALILSSALRLTAVAALAAVPGGACAGIAALILSAMAGRAAMAAGLAALPPARAEGLGHAARSRPGGGMAIARLVVAGLLCLPAAIAALMLAGGAVVWALLAGMAATLVIVGTARRRLGGQTGDVLGTISLTTETAMLTTFALAV